MGSRFYFEHCFGFTCESSGGNAAGVVLPEQDRLLTDAERQQAAKVLGFSETVFVSSIDTGLSTDSSASVSISLRYMTPLAEVDLCGHATIACLGLLHSSGRLGGTCQGELHTRAGEVGFRIEEPPGGGGDSGRAAEAVVFMQQLAPDISAPLEGAELKELAAALGVSLGTLETWSADWAPRVASTGLRDLLVKLPSLADLRALNPNMRALARLSKRLDVVSLHAFCAVRGAEALHFQGVDYHVRNFAPLVGIDEEAATGTSNCALACALQATGALPAGFARRDAACRLYGLGAALVFAQGDAMGTRGLSEVSAEPYIFTIDDFLSEAECDALISKMADQSVVEEKPSSEKLQRRGERTSRSVVLQNAEVAGLRDRLAAMVGVQLSQMQPLKITSDPSFYARQRARRQGAPPLVERGVGWASDARSALLSMPRREDLVVRPRRGMAVIHFPCTSASAGLIMDANADHESEPAVDTKYVCQQFIWSAPMDSDRLDERLRRKFSRFEEQQPREPLSEVVV